MLQHGQSLLHNKFLTLLYLELDLLLDRDLERDLDLSAKTSTERLKLIFGCVVSSSLVRLSLG